jgi:hypothetical protein
VVHQPLLRLKQNQEQRHEPHEPLATHSWGGRIHRSDLHSQPQISTNRGSGCDYSQRRCKRVSYIGKREYNRKPSPDQRTGMIAVLLANWKTTVGGLLALGAVGGLVSHSIDLQTTIAVLGVAGAWVGITASDATSASSK